MHGSILLVIMSCLRKTREKFFHANFYIKIATYYQTKFILFKDLFAYVTSFGRENKIQITMRNKMSRFKNILGILLSLKRFRRFREIFRKVSGF